MAYEAWDANWLTFGRKTVDLCSSPSAHLSSFPSSQRTLSFPPAQVDKQYSKGQGLSAAHSRGLRDQQRSFNDTNVPCCEACWFLHIWRTRVRWVFPFPVKLTQIHPLATLKVKAKARLLWVIPWSCQYMLLVHPVRARTRQEINH